MAPLQFLAVQWQHYMCTAVPQGDTCRKEELLLEEQEAESVELKPGVMKVWNRGVWGGRGGARNRGVWWGAGRGEAGEGREWGQWMT